MYLKNIFVDDKFVGEGFYKNEKYVNKKSM